MEDLSALKYNMNMGGDAAAAAAMKASALETSYGTCVVHINIYDIVCMVRVRELVYFCHHTMRSMNHVLLIWP